MTVLRKVLRRSPILGLAPTSLLHAGQSRRQLFGIEGGFEDGSYLAEMPRTTGKAWVTWFLLGDDRLQLTPAVLHRGILYDLDPETVLNLSLLYKPLPWMTVLVSSFNVFNEPITHPYYALAPDGTQVLGRQLSRTLRLGVSASF